MSRYFPKLTLISLIILVISVLSAAPNNAQNALPPHVIDVWPVPGVEITPEAIITITFDQPMNRTSVEAAVTIDPSFAVSMTWQDDRTLDFKAEDGWSPHTTYTIRIGTSAYAQNDMGLVEAYTLAVQTARSLQVASISPENGTEGVAAEDARIVITFDHPVVPLVSTVNQSDLPVPITIQPAVAGSGEWINTSIYVFSASAALKGNTTYTVTVPAGLASTDGNSLAAPFVSTFRTLAPQTLTILATSIWGQYKALLLDSAFEVIFSQPMDTSSTEAAFRLEAYDDRSGYEDWSSVPKENVPGTFQWNAAATKLTFTPIEPLKNAYGYSVTIETTAQSAAGAATLKDAASAHFGTVGLPGVSEVSPKSSEIIRPGRRRVVFSFNTLMNTATYENHYRITPEPPGEVVPFVYDDGRLALEFEQQVDVIYTVTLLPGIEDVYGNATTSPYNLMYFVQNDDVRTNVQTNLRSDFVVVGTYQDAPQLPLTITGKPTITLDIYRLDIETLDAAYRWKSDDPYYYSAYYGIGSVGRLYQALRSGYLDAIPWVKPENLISTETETYSVGKEAQNILMPLADAEHERLPAGSYAVEITSPSALGWNGDSKMGFVLAVSDVSLTVKNAPGEALVWVTDFASAEPVKNTDVQVYQNGAVIAEGETDADGVFRLPKTEQTGTVFIQTSGKGVYGIWNSSLLVDGKASKGYLYTDRPIYRPGETVYYRGVLRDQNDMDYTVPDVQQLRVFASTPSYYDYYVSTQDAAFYNVQVDVTNFGTFSGAITPPNDLSLGSYTIYADSCVDEKQNDNYCYSSDQTSITFEVGDFRVPEYEVTVTPQQDEIISGDPLNALVLAKYYFGGALGQANITWNIYRDYYYNGYYVGDTGFQYRGERGYTFTDEDYGDGQATNSTAPLPMDNDGNYLVTTPVTVNSSRPARMSIEATVTDESGQAISARSSILVHPANVYVGLRTSATFVPVQETVSIDVLSVTPQSEIQPNQRIDLEIVEVRWVRHTISFGRYEWKTESIPVNTLQVTSDADGKAVYTFTPPNAGIFRLRAVTKDEKGRTASSAIRIYARSETGQKRSGIWWDPYYYDNGYCGNSSEVQQLRLIPNNTTYRPGDTAEIFIPNPYDGPVTALITLERAGIMHYETVVIEGEALTYSFPITDAYAPTIYVGVVMMRAISADNPDPLYIRGSVRLDVEPVNRRLNVTVTPSEDTAKPGDRVSFDVMVTDSHGNPVQAEVGLALTDEAALALRPPKSGTLEAQFYGQQRLSVSTSASIRALLTAPDNSSSGGCGGGGGGGMPTGIIRDDFIYTPLWSPHTVTDESGRATVSVVMPDNLTRWRLDARAVTAETQVGQAEINIVSTLPLIVRPVTPRFFVVGDQMPVAAVVNNNTDTQQIVDVTLQVVGLRVEGVPLTQTVTLAAGGRARVEWPVRVEDTTGVDITVFAVSPYYQDAARPTLTSGPNNTIPVYRYTAPETVRTGGMLTNSSSATEIISLPSRLSDVNGTLTVQLDPSLAAATVDGLGYLRNFPYQCIEQTVSRFLPNIITYRALSDLNLSNAELENNLDQALGFGLDKLTKEQNADGGWGWFGGTESNPLTTAYALLGLVEAQASGHAIDSEMIEKAATYLSRQFISLEVNTPSWSLNRQAFLLYVLARWQKLSAADDPAHLLNIALELYDNRLELSLAGRAFLLMSYHELAPEAEASASLASDLNRSVILSATGAHWEESETDWWNWGSDTRTTALALTALVRYDPNNPLLPNVVRWLMLARRGDHWESTQETSWALIALTDWMVTTGELHGDYSYTVTLNDTAIGSGHITPDTVQESHILQAQVSDLLHDENNPLVIERGEGDGALYYTAALDLELPADEVQPISRGVTVSREYFLNDNTQQTISSATVGDIITVRLSLTVPQDVYYFVLEDTLPAGAEIIDTNLLTSTDTVQGPILQRNDPHWYWGYWHFDKTELRNKGAVLYADYLPRGAYVFSYQVRATSPGNFQVIPAHAFAFYQPEVFGRTDGQLFIITE